MSLYVLRCSVILRYIYLYFQSFSITFIAKYFKECNIFISELGALYYALAGVDLLCGLQISIQSHEDFLNSNLSVYRKNDPLEYKNVTNQPPNLLGYLGRILYLRYQFHCRLPSKNINFEIR